MIRFVDKKNRFVEVFNPDTGFYARSGVIDQEGKDTGVDPFMRCFPSLIDIGIMQTCVCAHKCNVDCYQKAIDRTGKNMSVEDYRSIMEQCKGKIFQCLYENEVVLRRVSDGTVGSVYIKDAKIGDEVYCGNNKFATIYEKNEKLSDVFEIDIGYGKKIIATKEHRFQTNRGLVTVSDLLIGDKLVDIGEDDIIQSTDRVDVVRRLIDLGMDDEYFISDCPGLEDVCNKIGIKRNPNKTVNISHIKEYIDEIDYSDAQINKDRSPYKFQAVYKISECLMKLLGHYVGNGSRRTYTINSKQLSMISAIEKSLYEYFPNIKYKKAIKNEVCKIELNTTILHKEIFDKIFGCRQSNGVKQLPNFIFSLSKEMKLAFLSGYFCDGNLRINTSDGKYGDIVFNTSSEKLYKDICLLLKSINVDYSVRTEKEKQVQFSKVDSRIINRKQRYRIVIGNLKEIFKLKGVVDDHYNGGAFNSIVYGFHDEKYLRDRKGYVVKSITKCQTPKRVVDINIDSEDHLFVTSHGVITHNCALGGAGDVDTHENFEDILRITREYGIVPNFTTSGIAMTKEKAEICKKYVGAIAVSEHFSPYTDKAIDLLLDAGVKTNIHYVLSTKTIDDAIQKLKTNGFKHGINAVVFLTYKPIGLGKIENILTYDDPRVKEFFELVDGGKFHHKIGFDSCAASGIVNFTKNIDSDSLDYCEGGRHSMYIDANMNSMPCSFGNQDPKWFVSLRDHTIQEAWNGEVFERFRSSLKNSCVGCKDRTSCAGGCPISRDIVLCNRQEKNLV